ncbi:MAG: RNA-binding S4 domain-containing protein [Cyanobacteria bacterium P01_H01_bin.74]
MRLDKFLKVSRLVKRRTVATELCNAGLVMINNKIAKPATAIKVHDIISIQFGAKQVAAKVLHVPEKAVPAQLASTLYLPLDTTP